MGRPKALLPCPGDHGSFVTHIVSALYGGGVEEVIVVGRPTDENLRTEVEGLQRPPRFVPNPDADRGQLSSVLAGLNAVDRPGVQGILVVPVDAPLVTSATVEALLATFRTTSSPIVRAVHRGAHGHPVIFSRAVFAELRRADPSVGAKAVTRAYEHAIANVDVDDPGVVQDIDTPEDYEKLFGAGLFRG